MKESLPLPKPKEREGNLTKTPVPAAAQLRAEWEQTLWWTTGALGAWVMALQLWALALQVLVGTGAGLQLWRSNFLHSETRLGHLVVGEALNSLLRGLCALRTLLGPPLPFGGPFFAFFSPKL